jgi:hypothetical protein
MSESKLKHCFPYYIHDCPSESASNTLPPLLLITRCQCVKPALQLAFNLSCGWAARFFLVQRTKTGESIQNFQKIYQITTYVIYQTTHTNVICQTTHTNVIYQTTTYICNIPNYHICKIPNIHICKIPNIHIGMQNTKYPHM